MYQNVFQPLSIAACLGSGATIPNRIHRLCTNVCTPKFALTISMQTQKLRHEPIFANKRLVEQRWDERHIYTKYNRKQMCYGTAARSYQQIEQTRTSTPSACNLPELRLELLPSAPDEGVASADGQRHNGHERNSYMDIAELVWAVLMRLGLPI